MDILPEELVFEIFKYLDFHEIIRCSMINQWINYVSKKDIFWYPKLKEFTTKFKRKGGTDAYKKYIGYHKLTKLYEIMNGKKPPSMKSLHKLINKRAFRVVSPTVRYGHRYIMESPESFTKISKVFQFLPLLNLKEIELINHDIEYIPPDIGLLICLEELKLDRNNITELPNEFGNLVNLKILELNGNQISHFPNQILCLEKLERLTLSNNKIKKLPNNIDNLKSLTNLLLDNNQLEELPDSFGNLNNLTVLHLNNNKLGGFPFTFGHLINLTSLQCSHNRIIEILETFCMLISLEKANLSHNNISELPQRFNKLLNLTIINLNHNQFTQIPFVYNNLKLSQIALENNRILNTIYNTKKGNRLNIYMFDNPVIGSLKYLFQKITNIPSFDDYNIKFEFQRRYSMYY